jgi:hypothetical protein
MTSTQIAILAMIVCDSTVVFGAELGAEFFGRPVRVERSE